MYSNRCVQSLVVFLTITAGWQHAFAQSAANAPQNVDKPKFDFGYIPPSAVGIVAAYPRSVLLSKDMEFIPREVFSAAGLKYAGIDPIDIDQIMVVIEPPSPTPIGAVVAHFSKPLVKGQFIPLLMPKTTESDLDGKPYRKGTDPNDASMYQPDDNTLIVGNDEAVRKIVANHAAPQASKLSTMLGQVGTPDIVAVVNVEALRPTITAIKSQQPIPPVFAGVAAVPDLIQFLAIKLDLTGDMATAITIRANDDEAAEQIENMLNGIMDIFKPLYVQQMMKLQPVNDESLRKAQAQSTKRIVDRMVEMLKPVRNGSTLAISGKLRDNVQLWTSGVMGIGFLSGVQAARTAATRTVSMNNLKQIMLASFNYEAANGEFPPRAVFKDGKPLLSWRVKLLPYLEQEALYKKFHLDEPWDSPSNVKLIPLMPKIFANPSGKGPQSGKTPYLAVCGKGLMFEGEKGRKLTEITDGTSNTIMFVEAKSEREVTWTKPDDWEFDEKKPMDGLGSNPTGFIATFADGSVQFMSNSVDPTLFKAMLTIAGGEIVQRP